MASSVVSFPLERIADMLRDRPGVVATGRRPRNRLDFNELGDFKVNPPLKRRIEACVILIRNASGEK
jgi:hypothetical protein